MKNTFLIITVLFLISPSALLASDNKEYTFNLYRIKDVSNSSFEIYGNLIEIEGSKWHLALLSASKDNGQDKVGLNKAADSNEMEFDRSKVPPKEYQSLPSEIFIETKNYEFSRIYQEDNIEEVKVILREKPLGTGILKLDIQHIDSIRLLQIPSGMSNRLVVLDYSKSECIIPAGIYEPVLFKLKNSEGKAFGPVKGVKSLPKLSVKAGQIIELPFGTPLRHDVNVSQMGKVIGLDYKLVGKDGEEYNPSDITKDAKFASEVSIYKGDRLLSTGQFEYG